MHNLIFFKSFRNMVLFSEFYLSLQLFHDVKYFFFVVRGWRDLDTNWQACGSFKGLTNIFCIEIVVVVIEVKLVLSRQGNGYNSSRVAEHIPDGSEWVKVLQFLL